VVGAVGVAVLAAAPPAAHAGDGYFTLRNLSVTTRAPASYNAQPNWWTTPWDLARHMAYVESDGMIVVGTVAAGSSDWWWYHTPGHPSGGNKLSVYSYAWDRSSHVIYLTGGHVHELWSSQASPAWQDVDLTVQTGAQVAWSVDSGYVQDGKQHIIFSESTLDNHIWEMWFTPGVGWQARDLSAATGTAPAGRSIPAGIGRGDTFGQAVAYVARDQSIHLLSQVGDGGWVDQPIGAWTHAPKAPDLLQRMDIFQSPGGYKLSVLYNTKDTRSTDNRVHLLSWTELTGWTDTDVAGAAGYTGHTAIDPGAAFFFEADASDHIFMVNNAKAVIEFVHTRTDQWYAWKDQPDGSAAGWIGAYAAPDNSAGLSYTEYVAFPAESDASLMLMELTAFWTA
jgi:hypothetical protein